MDIIIVLIIITFLCISAFFSACETAITAASKARFHQLAKDATFPYRLDNGFYEPGYIKGSNGNILLSVGFKF